MADRFAAEWPTTFLVTILLLLLIIVVTSALAIIGLTHWWHRKRRIHLLVAAVICIAIALEGVRFLESRFRLHLERITIARELGVVLSEQLYQPLPFPAGYLRSRIVDGVTTRDEVREVLHLAKSRYLCWQGDAEKYLFLSHNYHEAQIVNVFYDERDIVKESQVVDSADPVRFDGCSRF